MSNRLLTTLATLAAFATATGPALAADYTFKVAHTNAANEVQDMGLQKMKELLEAKTDGAATLEIYAGGQLGDEQQTVEGVMLGSLDMGMTSNAMLSNYVEDYKVFDLPFLFPSIPALGEKVDANWDMMEASANKSGFQLIGIFSSGIRHLMTSKPINGMEDLAGMKIRTMQNPIHVEAFRAYGANPTPMSYSELYGALQAGVVDGAEGASTGYDGMKFYEVAPDFALVGWLNMTAPITMKKDTFDALPAEIQTALMEAGAEAATWQRQYVVDMEQPLLDSFAAHGVTITTPDTAPFIEASQPLYESQLTTDGQKALFDALTAK
ncbi:tripartite ATP-independent transporter DctP family solute receptor [Rhodobacter aestuarii]|uniref:Tripartite ATP-independent transporter solute receptor, DctP family n=1 Tax=Rhodobacter aestuarii TaxID=453582 RepID=A0A1N7K081_9RHOB|nr:MULTISPECIES: TRAP transporter substrate-binding protein [Rhodobacter]PTV95914.1 tripartite ATP-independent transporter DctP family solute receptor [Rhodobacter aestuarii]SIS54988.1 tripartite ATP-independent transporter solute receptor, DctP family [Rhodobacter aestuarii]SOC10882.1 tripartite ATP-independent transporter DctP family solute receptor [Rhodobacter sp. JA431]